MLMAFPPSLTIQPYLAKAQGMFPSFSSDCQPGLMGKSLFHIGVMPHLPMMLKVMSLNAQDLGSTVSHRQMHLA